MSSPAYITSMSETAYRAASGFSASQLRLFSSSPSARHFQVAYYEAREKSTVPTEFGRLFHEKRHLGVKFAEAYLVTPPGLRRGTKKWAELAQAGPLLKATDAAKIAAMDEAVQAHPSAALLVASGDKECSFFFDWEGLRFKGRADHVNHDLRVIADYKTVLSADPKDRNGLKKFLRDGLYHYQAALYRQGLKAVTGEDYSFVFVCIEKVPPFAITCCTLPDALMAQGRREVLETAKRLDHCIRHDEWPSYPTDIIEVEPNFYDRVSSAS